MNPLQIPPSNAQLHGPQTVRARTWAQITVYVFAVGVVLRGVAILVLLAFSRAITAVSSGDTRATLRLEPLGNSYDGWDGAASLVLFAGALTVLFWVYHAHKALAEIGVHQPELSAGWAVGSWFLPIANLWMPVTTMHHLWRASSPLPTDQDVDAWKQAARTPAAWLWWVCLLASNVLARLFTDALGSANTAAKVQSAIGLGLIGNLLSLTGVCLWGWLVLRIAQRQLYRGIMVADLFSNPRG